MKVRILLSAALVCGLTIEAFAITVIPITFEQLVEEAAAVVYGRVRDVRGQWTADRRGIDSLVTVEPLRYVKGDLGDRVVVRMPGGEAGGRIHLIPGAPVVRDGDLVVMFLRAEGPAVPTIIGVTQGLFRVSVDRHSGAPLVTPPPLKASAAGRIIRGAAERRALTIDAFASAVRDAAGAAR